MTIKELRNYLNTLGQELDNIQVKLLSVRIDKDYHDIEISTLKQTKQQLIEHGLIFEVDQMDTFENLVLLDFDTMLDIEDYFNN
ncbi:MAG: hypothetical protein ACRDB9_06525 [Cetobacterium sp.]